MTTSQLPLDHSGMGVLPHEECLHRLRDARMGRIAFVTNGEPQIFPVNHGLDGDSVVFRTSPGSKLFAADMQLPVAFEVDGADPDRRVGWSVVVSGTASSVVDAAEVARLRKLGVWPWADSVQRDHWVRIRPLSITGRVVVH